MNKLNPTKITHKFSDKFTKQASPPSNNSRKILKILAILWGIFASFSSLAIFSLIMTVLYVKTPTLDGKINIISLAVLAISMVIGGLISGKKANHKGLLHGLVLGIIMTVIFIILTLNNATAGSLNMVSIIFKGLIIIFFASLGGIFSIKQQ